jgi:hypothetical protein
MLNAGRHSNGRLSPPNTTAFEVFAHSFMVCPVNLPCLMRFVPDAEALSEAAAVYWREATMWCSEGERIRSSQRLRECRSWIMRVILALQRRLPLLPDERTFSESVSMFHATGGTIVVPAKALKPKVKFEQTGPHYVLIPVLCQCR